MMKNKYYCELKDIIKPSKSFLEVKRLAAEILKNKPTKQIEFVRALDDLNFEIMQKCVNSYNLAILQTIEIIEGNRYE